MRGSRYVRGKTRREWLAMLGIGAAAGATGCTHSGGGGSDASLPEHYNENEYVSVVGSGLSTLVHHQIADQGSGNAVALTLDGAYTVTTEREIFPLWMDLNRADDQGRVYEAELREGLEWSDPYGEMTAEDWVYHIRNIHQGEENWAGSQASTDWANIEVEQTGRLTFEVTLPQPNVEFPFEPVLWAAQCYPKDLIQPYVEEQDEDLNTLAYTGNLGAYEYERWERDAEYVVTRNDDYYVRDLDDVPDDWGDAPHFDSYRLRVVTEESSRLQALRAREVTSAGIPPSRVQGFRDNEEINVNVVPQPFLSVIAYNQRRNGWDPLRNRRVRQALSTAINKTEIAEDVHRGLADVSHTFQPRWSEWYVDDEVREFGEGDTHSYDDARSILESELGSDYGYDGDMLLGPESEQVTLSLVYNNTAERFGTTAELVKQYLGEIGIDVELNGLTGDRLLSQAFRNEWVGEGDPPWNSGPYNAGPRDMTESQIDWDMLYGIRFNTYPRTPATTENFWTERGSSNSFGYVPDADMKSKFNDARSTPDEEERREILGEIFGILSSDQPVDFVVLEDSISGYQSYVEGPREEFGHGWNSLQTWKYSEV